MKTIYVINHYTDENNDGKPTENDDITIYLSKKDYEEHAESERFPYKNTKISTYKLLDDFFMRLKHYKELGFELEFRCEKKES